MKRQFPCDEVMACADCPARANEPRCDYAAIFEVNGRGGASSALSWMVVPSLRKRAVHRQGDRLSLEVRLFGALARHELFLRRFLPALQIGGMLDGLGRWRQLQGGIYGKLDVVDGWVWQEAGWAKIFDRNDKVLPIPVAPVRHVTPPAGFAEVGPQRIAFVTPVALYRNGEPVLEITLDEVLAAARRRLVDVGAVRRGSDAYRELCDIVEEAKLSSTRSSEFEPVDLRSEQMKAARHKEARAFCIGSFVTESVPGRARALLAAAALLHVGKGTRQGCGGFAVASAGG